MNYRLNRHSYLSLTIIIIILVAIDLSALITLPVYLILQLAKTDGGIKVTTDHGEELIADVVLFATGISTS